VGNEKGYDADVFELRDGKTVRVQIHTGAVHITSTPARLTVMSSSLPQRTQIFASGLHEPSWPSEEVASGRYW
jgi:hypothetical protein